MRKLIGTTTLALVVVGTTPAHAQQEPVIPTLGCTSYEVREGDNLWNLASLKLEDPTLWSWLVEQNPVLQEPGRSYTRGDGKEIVRIYPGEKLFCLGSVDVSLSDEDTPSRARFDPDLVVLGTSPEVEEKTFFDYVGEWWWILIPLILITVIVWWLSILRESRKDPVRSGPPQINGGINSVAQATERFSARGRENDFTVLSVVPGTIYGTMNVSYGDGTERPRTLNGERAYQATVRRSDGTVESIFMLQACGNDLRYGGISRYIPGPGFRFVPDTAEVARAAETVSSGAETSSGPYTSQSPATTGKPELKIELKPGEREGETSMVRVTGAPTESMVITVTDDSFTLRFHPPKKD